MSPWTTTLLAWMGTYLIHSTVLLLAAWLLLDRLGSLKARERGWRVALLGGVLTASLQVGAGIGPAAGWFSLADAPPEPVVRVHTAAPLTAASSLLRESSPPMPLAEAESIDWTRAALWAWLSVGALLLAGLASAGLRGRRWRRELARIEFGPWSAWLAELRAQASMRRRVRIYRAPNVEVPLTLGVLRPSILLPERALFELEPGQRRALLAHEVAHVARFDVLWSTAARVVERVLFLQPLNHLARRRLDHLAELSADRWAARVTGDRVALARCLTEVAGWLCTRTSPLACSMVSTRSPLAERVERILAEDPSGRRGNGAPGLILALCGTTLFAPGFAAGPPPPVEQRVQEIVDQDPGTIRPLVAALDQLGFALSDLASELFALQAEAEQRADDPLIDQRLDELTSRFEHLSQTLDKLRSLLQMLQSLHTHQTPHQR